MVDTSVTLVQTKGIRHPLWNHILHQFSPFSLSDMVLSASTIILEYVCPTLGCIMGNIMFAAPFKSVKEAVKRGYLGNLNPTPWAFMTGNTIGWITYSILKNNLFLFFANMPGFLLSVWFNLCAAKLQYQDHYTKEIRKSIVHYLEHEEETKSQLFCKVDGTNDDNCIEGTAKEQNQPSWKSATDWGTIVLNVTAQITPAPAPHETMVIVIVIIWTAIVGIVGLVNSLPMSTRELIVGISVNINLCFFYGAPLSSIAQVCRDRTSESIHIATMVTNILNSCFWTIYGIAILDAFIYVPNGLGAILGFLQVGMVLLFPRKRTSRSPPRTEENALNSSKHRPETTPDIARSANDQVTIPAGCSDKLEGL